MIDETGSHSSPALNRRQLMAIVKCEKWKDDVHEDEGGNDAIGPRPQDGRDMMKEETENIIREASG